MAESRAKGIMLALAAALCYGNVPVLARLAYEAGIPAIESIVLRTYTVALLLGLVAGTLRLPAGISREALPSFIGQIMATIGVSLCYLMSVQFIPVGLAVIIFFTFPVIVVVLSPAIEGHRPSVLVMLVAAMAFAGLAIAIGPGFDKFDPRGLLLAAGAALSCVLQFFSGRSLSKHLQPAAFASLVHAIILPIIACVALLIGQGHVQVLESRSIGLTGLAGMLGVSLAYLLGYFFHMSSLKAAPASTVVPFFNFEPVVSTVMAGLVLHETLAANQYWGGAIVLTSLVLCSMIGTRRSANG
jgi:drug/metabolite transporter (DMT)-like permease